MNSLVHSGAEERASIPSCEGGKTDAKGGLRLGCLVPTLAEQLSGYRFDADAMCHFQREMEAVSRAHIRSLIPYSAAMKAYDKLAKNIVAHVDKQNPLPARTVAARRTVGMEAEGRNEPQDLSPPDAKGGGAVKGVEEQTVYDRPDPAISVLADALNISTTQARSALRKLVAAGYAVAPRAPTNSMLVAYLQSYGQVAKNPTTMMAAIGKARRRWAAMAEAGTAVALSTKRLSPTDANQPTLPDTPTRGEGE